ncbi:MAG: tRNA 4-thiouridine(8) synthase ThiI, partial [Candidatus Hodarchaeales archaeon]
EERIRGSKGSISGYDREIHVHIRKNGCYCHGYKHDGPGGFPLGSNGKAICLVSGGIDSPVASWLMMKTLQD